MIKKIISRIFVSLFLFFFFATPAYGQTILTQDDLNPQIKVKVTEISENEITVTDKDKNTYTIPIDIGLAGTNEYKPGDVLLIERITGEDGTIIHVVAGAVRDFWIWFLCALFALTVFLINGKKGVRLIFNLGVTGSLIVFVNIPLILRGWSPIWTTVLIGCFAMTWSIYFSYGFNKKSHATLLGIGISLLMTGFFSTLFVKLASLTGFADEEAGVLIALGHSVIDMRGLLLAAIMIGTLGVLDDVAITQASLVEEILSMKKDITRLELFKKVFHIGQQHTGAIINTLALAYAGASFPLVILISLGVSPFNTLEGTLNNEVIATEITRTLVGSIVILLSMPITTMIAIWILYPENANDKKLFFKSSDQI